MLAFCAGLLLPRCMAENFLTPFWPGGGRSPLEGWLPLACTRLLFLREKRPMAGGGVLQLAGEGGTCDVVWRARPCCPRPCDSGEPSGAPVPAAADSTFFCATATISGGAGGRGRGSRRHDARGQGRVEEEEEGVVAARGTGRRAQGRSIGRRAGQGRRGRAQRGEIARLPRRPKRAEREAEAEEGSCVESSRRHRVFLFHLPGPEAREVAGRGVEIRSSTPLHQPFAGEHERIRAILLPVCDTGRLRSCAWYTAPTLCRARCTSNIRTAPAYRYCRPVSSKLCLMLPTTYM